MIAAILFAAEYSSLIPLQLKWCVTLSGRFGCSEIRAAVSIACKDFFLLQWYVSKQLNYYLMLVTFLCSRLKITAKCKEIVQIVDVCIARST